MLSSDGMWSQENQEQKAQYWRSIFDTIPLPAFIVDAEVRIEDFNTAAEQLLSPEPALALQRRGGEAFHCINAEHNGCGKAEPCEDCAIRNSIRRAITGRTTHRKLHQVRLREGGRVHAIDLLVTASLLPYTDPPRALLLLENLTEVVKLRRRRTRRASRS